MNKKEAQREGRGKRRKAERESGKEEMKINYLRVGHSVSKILGVSYKNTKLQVEESTV